MVKQNCNVCFIDFKKKAAISNKTWAILNSSINFYYENGRSLI